MIHISIARSGFGHMARNVDLQISDRVRLLFHHSLLHKIKISYLQSEKTFTRDSESTFGDVLPSNITGRNGLRLRVRAATEFSQVTPCGLKKARAYVALRQLLATILRQHVGCHMCSRTDAC